MSPAPRVHIHLVSWTDEPWDLEESLFSLVSQEGPTAVSVSVPASLESYARDACARLARLGGPVDLRPGTPSRWDPEAAAVTAWVAGTVATPDHLARALASSGPGGALAVAPARRVLCQPVPRQPPYVVTKTWRFTSSMPSIGELGRDPPFLGRCLVPAGRAPRWLPGTLDEHRRWAEEAWAVGPVTRVAGPPTVDLPDLRKDRGIRSADDVRDALADLRYQSPRWLERRAPLVFDRLRGLYHRIRNTPH